MRWLVLLYGVVLSLPVVCGVPSVPVGPSLAALRLQPQLDTARPGETITVAPGDIVFSNSSLLVQGAVRLFFTATSALSRLLLRE